MASTTIGVKIDTELRQRLSAVAESMDRSSHWVMKKALLEYLEREEAAERIRREDEERWERYVLTGDAVPHDEVVAWLEALADGKDAPCPR